MPGLTAEDRDWLCSLDVELHPPRDTRSAGRKLADKFRGSEPKFAKPRAKLTRQEVLRIFQLVEEADLFTMLYSSGTICGVGIIIFEHEQFPGTGPEELLHFSEEHLPESGVPSVYDRLKGKKPPKKKARAPGDCDPDAWELFTKFTHTEKNRRWIDQYGLEMHFDKQHYDY
jgi:hypothetical protein